MIQIRLRSAFAAMGLTAISLFAIAGCAPQATPDAPAGGTPPAGGPPMGGPGGGTGGKMVSGGTGPEIFKSQCVNCHTINGEGGKQGPELSKAGAEAEHTATWFASFIKNPKSKDANSRMPGFEGRIDDKDLQTVGKYLTTLK